MMLAVTTEEKMIRGKLGNSLGRVSGKKQSVCKYGEMFKVIRANLLKLHSCGLLQCSWKLCRSGELI